MIWRSGAFASAAVVDEGRNSYLNFYGEISALPQCAVSVLTLGSQMSSAKFPIAWDGKSGCILAS
jgi:hypothetical protein